MKLARIKSLRVLPGPKLALSFSDGHTGSVDLAPLSKQGGLFSPLADARRAAEARIGPDGRSVEWPWGLDLCADALCQQTSRDVRASA